MRANAMGRGHEHEWLKIVRYVLLTINWNILQPLGFHIRHDFSNWSKQKTKETIESARLLQDKGYLAALIPVAFACFYNTISQDKFHMWTIFVLALMPTFYSIVYGIASTSPSSIIFYVIILPIYLLIMSNYFPIDFVMVFTVLLVFSSLIQINIDLPVLAWIPKGYETRLPLLVLRSHRDHRLKQGRPLVERGPHGRKVFRNYIGAAGRELWDLARILLVLPEDHVIADMYSEVETTVSDDNWLDQVQAAASQSWAIVMIPGFRYYQQEFTGPDGTEYSLIDPDETPGLVREMLMLREEGLLSKTVIFMPPSEFGFNMEEQWASVRDDLQKEFGFRLPRYNARGMLYRPDGVFGIEANQYLTIKDNGWRKLIELFDPNDFQGTFEGVCSVFGETSNEPPRK